MSHRIAEQTERLYSLVENNGQSGNEHKSASR
jgi:hypothetical protein